MKKVTIFLGLLCALGTMSARATLLSPTNMDVNFITSSNEYTIGIFDDADINFQNNLNVNMGVLYVDPSSGVTTYSGLVEFSPWPEDGAGPYQVTNDPEAIPDATNTLLLGDSTDFMVALFDNVSQSWIADSSVSEGTQGNVSVLTFNMSSQTDVENIVAVDVQMSPVPVPAAVWLFATGLLGLVGVARRRN